MKKLISVAASLAMAATMVSSAVPFATGAADATKGFELRAFENTDGSAASTTISADAIKAGKVVVPIALYVTENTNDSASMTAQWTVNSTDGDASNAYVSFVGHEPGAAYYGAEKDVTLADGTTGSTNNLIGFAGTMKSNRSGDFFSPNGTLQAFSLEKQDSANTQNAYGAATWVVDSTTGNYAWSGAKSDTYPIYVQDVVFEQNTPAGTYTIDFLDYVPDSDFPDNRSCMIEADGKMTTGNSKLTLKGLTITIEGDSTGSSTPAPTTTTTTTQGGGAETTTTTAGGNNNNDDVIADDFIVTPLDVEVEPGEDVEVEVYVQAGGHKVGQYVVKLDETTLPQGITYTVDDPTCYAVDDTKFHEFDHLGDGYYCDTLASAEPTNVIESEPVIIFNFHVPASAQPGVYEWKITKFHVVEDGYNGVEFDATVIPAKITIKGEVESDATTTTTQAATTTTTTAATTTTTTTAAPGTPVYGDANCDNKVNIADVVVLNKWLADANSYNLTDQGKLNADCCDEKGGTDINANDSDAIIKSIVHLVTLPCTAAQL